MAILHDLASIGQSIWLDNINRTMLDDGSLKALIDQGLRGMTSNPSIFMKAISQSNDYDANIIELKQQGKSTFDIYDALTIKDVQDAADQFAGVYEDTGKLDGYVSLEINPQLANEDDAQYEEGLRLWQTVNRPNVMIKVPATGNGINVVRRLIAKGVNVNTTLIFSVDQYRAVVEAYKEGLELLIQDGGDPSGIHSVASFFVSRIDTAVDQLLEDRIQSAEDETVKTVLSSLRGQAAVANCELAFDVFMHEFGDDFDELKKKSANVQRLLWASTSAKNPAYSDLKYVHELIADPTVNTLPSNTLDALLDHGSAKTAIPNDVLQAQNVVDELKLNEVDLNAVCVDLLNAGVDAFIGSYDDLMTSIDQKSAALNV